MQNISLPAAHYFLLLWQCSTFWHTHNNSCTNNKIINNIMCKAFNVGSLLFYTVRDHYHHLFLTRPVHYEFFICCCWMTSMKIIFVQHRPSIEFNSFPFIVICWMMRRVVLFESTFFPINPYFNFIFRIYLFDGVLFFNFETKRGVSAMVTSPPSRRLSLCQTYIVVSCINSFVTQSQWCLINSVKLVALVMVPLMLHCNYINLFIFIHGNDPAALPSARCTTYRHPTDLTTNLSQ